MSVGQQRIMRAHFEHRADTRAAILSTKSKIEYLEKNLLETDAQRTLFPKKWSYFYSASFLVFGALISSITIVKYFTCTWYRFSLGLFSSIGEIHAGLYNLSVDDYCEPYIISEYFDLRNKLTGTVLRTANFPFYKFVVESGYTSITELCRSFFQLAGERSTLTGFHDILCDDQLGWKAQIDPSGYLKTLTEFCGIFQIYIKSSYVSFIILIFGIGCQITAVVLFAASALGLARRRSINNFLFYASRSPDHHST